MKRVCIPLAVAAFVSITNIGIAPPVISCPVSAAALDVQPESDSTCPVPSGAADTTPPDRPGFSPARAAVDFYQRYLSDLRYGRCQFDPSCSAYAEQAIERFGFLEGSILAADRLIRCNGSARRYQERGADGRLLDPAIEEPAPKTHPMVPTWLMPAVADTPDRFAEIDPRLRENIAFANDRAEEGDCWRAETEYLRVAFLADRRDVSSWASMMIGRCYFRGKQWNDASGAFLEAARGADREDDAMNAAFMAAAALFNKGGYGTAGAIVDRFSQGECPSPDPVERLAFLDGLCSLAEGQWDRGQRQFKAMAAGRRASRYHRPAAFLAEKASEGPRLPRKQPALAKALSAAVPGLGQLYAGRRLDAFRHFLFDGLLIYTAYELFSDEHYTGGYLVAGIALPFYLGNIVGAGRSAEHFNAETRAAHLARWIEEAGGM